MPKQLSGVLDFIAASVDILLRTAQTEASRGVGNPGKNILKRDRQTQCVLGVPLRGRVRWISQDDSKGKVWQAMAKKKAAVGLPTGTRVRVKQGIMSPEFPDVPIGGWTGRVMEASGKPPMMSYIIEWDEMTMSSMPKEYVDKCEAQQLYYRMANVMESDLETV